MQILEIIFGSIIFEFIGVSCKWIFKAISNKLQGKKPKTFSEIWNSRKKAGLQESVEHGWSSIFSGMAVTVILISLLICLTT